MQQPITRRNFGIGGILSLGLGGKSRPTLTGIRFERIKHGSSNNRYLLIHGDESTAREVLGGHMRDARGTAFLVENQTRLVEINGGRVDPNRIFSNEGANRSLSNLNPGASQVWITSAIIELQNSRHQLVNALVPPNGGVLFALHNNSSAYSVQAESSISDQIALNDPDNPHDFGICTNPRDFSVLSRGPYNVVLQNRRPTDDDGSLSRLAARLNFRYLNIEAKLGNVNKQKDMLSWAETVLG